MSDRGFLPVHREINNHFFMPEQIIDDPYPRSASLFEKLNPDDIKNKFRVAWYVDFDLQINRCLIEYRDDHCIYNVMIEYYCDISQRYKWSYDTYRIRFDSLFVQESHAKTTVSIHIEKKIQNLSFEYDSLMTKYNKMDKTKFEFNVSLDKIDDGDFLTMRTTPFDRDLTEDFTKEVRKMLILKLEQRMEEIQMEITKLKEAQSKC